MREVALVSLVSSVLNFTVLSVLNSIISILMSVPRFVFSG